MSDTTLALKFRYPYEEFADNVRAMPTVRRWEYTSRFGHVGTEQTSWTNNARVVEYFSDCYSDLKEALYKAELFLSICDYVGRHREALARKGLVDLEADNLITIEPALLRAVHCVFTTSVHPESTDPNKLPPLARALKDLQA